MFKNNVFEVKFQQFYKEIRRCQYLNTSVTNVVTKWIFWKKAATRASTFAKNVEVQIRKNYFRDFPLDKAAKEVIPAQPERADFLRKDVL